MWFFSAYYTENVRLTRKIPLYLFRRYLSLNEFNPRSKALRHRCHHLLLDALHTLGSSASYWFWFIKLSFGKSAKLVHPVTTLSDSQESKPLSWPFCPLLNEIYAWMIWMSVSLCVSHFSTEPRSTEEVFISVLLWEPSRITLTQC